MWSNFAVGAGWGGKKLFDLIELDGFSEKEERLIVRTAAAPYFYGSILLRALESKIIVVLTYVSKK
jgi:hypothetical protein